MIAITVIQGILPDGRTVTATFDSSKHEVILSGLAYGTISLTRTEAGAIQDMFNIVFNDKS